MISFIIFFYEMITNYDYLLFPYYGIMMKLKGVMYMNTTQLEELKKEIPVFEEMTKKFLNKEISMKDYKSFSGGYGCYAQRGGETFMIRLRMDQGIATKAKLKFIVDTCKKYHINKVHITTCQTFQLHNVPGNAVSTIMSEALDYGIVMRGGGGDFPRNVMCSPLTGIQKDEYFDVLPYAKAVGEYVLQDIQKLTLPRKLKIAFSNNEANKTHATFRDLGFCANADGSFDVYCAGGLGNNPRLGVNVGNHVNAFDILYYVEAMIRLFQRHGNYENRAKARTRYMQESLGIDGLKDAFSNILADVTSAVSLSLSIEPSQLNKTGKQENFDHPCIIEQKQAGLYTLFYHPIAGDIDVELLNQLYETIQPMEAVHIRISPQQDMYIVNANADEVTQLLPYLANGARTTFETSVACIGASICQVGIRDSQHMINSLVDAVRPYSFEEGVLPRIHISGCSSSCGTQQIAQIGLQGSVKVINKQAYPAFALSIHGKEERGLARFGELVGVILESDVINFFRDLGQQIQQDQSTYEQWIDTHPNELQNLLTTYTV